MVNLDANNNLPLHAQLKELLRKEILQGEFIEKIPNEHELMKRFNVSRSTVRQAVSDLVREGVLEKVHGKGTFIAHRPLEEWLGNISTYNEIVAQMGCRPSTRLLSQGKQNRPRRIAEVLKANQFYVIERLRFANDVPIAIEKQYYPLDIGLKLAEFDLNNAVLYELMESSLGIILWEADQTISSAQATKEEADLLRIPESTSVLVSERTIYNPEGRPVEYLRSIFRADTYSFRLKFARRKG